MSAPSISHRDEEEDIALQLTTDPASIELIASVLRDLSLNAFHPDILKKHMSKLIDAKATELIYTAILLHSGLKCDEIDKNEKPVAITNLEIGTSHARTHSIAWPKSHQIDLCRLGSTLRAIVDTFSCGDDGSIHYSAASLATKIQQSLKLPLGVETDYTLGGPGIIIEGFPAEHYKITYGKAPRWAPDVVQKSTGDVVYVKLEWDIQPQRCQSTKMVPSSRFIHGRHMKTNDDGARVPTSLHVSGESSEIVTTSTALATLWLYEEESKVKMLLGTSYVGKASFITGDGGNDGGMHFFSRKPDLENAKKFMASDTLQGLITTQKFIELIRRDDEDESKAMTVLDKDRQEDEEEDSATPSSCGDTAVSAHAITVTTTTCLKNCK